MEDQANGARAAAARACDVRAVPEPEKQAELVRERGARRRLVLVHERARCVVDLQSLGPSGTREDHVLAAGDAECRLEADGGVVFEPSVGDHRVVSGEDAELRAVPRLRQRDLEERLVR